MAPKRQNPHKAVAKWTHPIGTRVTVRRDDGTTFESTLLAGPEVMCGTAVVWIEGIVGCFALERVTPTEASR